MQYNKVVLIRDDNDERCLEDAGLADDDEMKCWKVTSHKTTISHPYNPTKFGSSFSALWDLVPSRLLTVEQVAWIYGTRIKRQWCIK